MLTNQVSGTLTKEEARRQQLLKYQQDAKKYAQKQKEKEDKKKAEKWKRYSHVDIGQPLSPVPGPDFATVRVNQQNNYDEEGIHGYVRELERENARLRREDEKRKEKLQKKLAHVDAGSRLNAGFSASANTTPVNSHLERLPFERNSNTQSSRSLNVSTNTNMSCHSPPFESHSQSSRSLNTGTGINMSRNSLPFESHSHNSQSSRSLNIGCGINTDHNTQSQENNCGADDKKKEEEFHREMRQVREKMQTLYTQGMRK